MKRVRVRFDLWDGKSLYVAGTGTIPADEFHRADPMDVLDLRIEEIKELGGERWQWKDAYGWVPEPGKEVPVYKHECEVLHEYWEPSPLDQPLFKEVAR